MRRLLGHLLATLLAAALSASVLLWTLGATLGNAPFLERTADQTQLYTHLAAGSPGADPAALRTGVESALPQFIDYVTKGGPLPSLNIAGVTDGPVKLGPADPAVTTAGQKLRTAALYLPAAVIVLVLIIIGVMGRLRWHTLARAAFGSAFSLGISAGIFWLAPGYIIDHSLKGAPDALSTSLGPFITAVLHALATHLGIAALSLLVIGIILRVLHGVFRLKDRFARPPKPKPQPPLPSSQIGPR